MPGGATVNQLKLSRSRPPVLYETLLHRKLALRADQAPGRRLNWRSLFLSLSFRFVNSGIRYAMGLSTPTRGMGHEVHKFFLKMIAK